MLSVAPFRYYATGGKPSKKPPSKTVAESADAPAEKKIKPKTKRVSKSAPKEPKESAEPIAELGKKKSTWEVGTLFELRSLQLLQENFSMALERVAGPGDGGVDLVGWWWLPQLPGLPELSNVTTEDGLSGYGVSRIRVLAQCKAEKSKLGPNYVREMEGVLHRVLHSGVSASGSELISSGGTNPPTSNAQLRPSPTVAMIVSQSRFTNNAMMRAMSSPIPFILLHLPPQPMVVKGAEAGEGNEEEGEHPSLQWNSALGSTSGLLKGLLEVRWQREAGGSSPRLWWQGQPMKSFIP